MFLFLDQWGLALFNRLALIYWISYRDDNCPFDNLFGLFEYFSIGILARKNGVGKLVVRPFLIERIRVGAIRFIGFALVVLV